jgi:excisionase family DNA binding protein
MPSPGLLLLYLHAQVWFNDPPVFSNNRRVFPNYPKYFRITTNMRVTMPTRKPRKLVLRSPIAKVPEILDVHMTAELLTVSPDTVYDLFKKGELPGRKVGRKWLTTRTAVLRWIENSAEEDTLARAIEQGDANALAAALKNGQVQVKKRT